MGTPPTQTSKSGGDSGTNDRRAVLRRNVVDSHLVTVDLAFQTGALVLDLSESGVGVQALSSAPLGASTSLQFDLPETGGRVDAVGRIAWTDSSGRVGISFEDIAELSRVHLAQWLSRERRPAVAAGANVAVPSWPPAYARDEIAALRRDLITEKLSGDAALTFVVERIRNVTRATGAAIALDNEGAVICRASSGNAPGVGARLDPNSGLSGECIRTGEIVRCEDTETDPRADRMVCRKLDLRSIVIVPIRVQGRPAGVLEAFSSRAHAFQSSDVLWLRRVTDLVAGIAARQPEMNAITGPQGLMAAVTLEPPARESGSDTETPLMMEDVIGIQEEISPPSPPPAKPTGRAEKFFIAATPPPSRDSLAQADAPLPADVINSPLARPAPPVLVPPLDRRAPRVVLNPVEEADAPAKTSEVTPSAAFAPPAISHTTIRPGEIQPRPTHTPPPARDWLSSLPPTPVAVQATGAAVAAAPAPITRPRRQEIEEEHEVGELPSFMRDSLAPSAQVSSPWRLRVTGAGILLVVVAVGGWQVWRAVAPPKAMPVDSGPRQPSPSSISTPPPVLTSTTTVTVPAAVPAKTSPVTATLAPKATPPATQAKTVAPVDSTKIISGPASATPRPAATTTAPIEVAKIEVTEAPPAIGLDRTASIGSNISSVLSAPVPAPSLDRPVVSEMSGGKLLRRVDPTYPSSAPSSGLRGEVVLKATIDKKGNVSKVTIVSGHALLAQSAANAVRRWQYEPFRLNGVPIEIENTIVVNFKSPGR